jgi:hypothetical protein
MRLTIQLGGMNEFLETGVDPEYLIFHSAKLHRTWRLKKLKEIQNGVLKVNGQIAFRYFLYELGCNIQSVTDGVVIDEWQIEMITMEMRD